MPFKDNLIIQLSDPNYVPVIKDSKTYYGGSQMWFPEEHWYSKDYVLHNYGCGTIATADMFLYLALQNKSLQSPETEIALKGTKQIKYENYDPYIRKINNEYTKTRHVIAVLGTKIASAINSYSKNYGLGLKANWKLALTYYDMLDIIQEMLEQDIPVILSIGPNTPNVWGKKGIPFYERKEIEIQLSEDASTEGSKPYYYKVVQQSVNSHYVTVTAIVKDDVAGQIMLRISSWGKQYYINYEEYRNYVESTSGVMTSSIVQVKKTL